MAGLVYIENMSSTNGKTVNGSRYYRALESVSIASALSTALTIYPCQIWVHQRSNADSLKLQLLSARKKVWLTQDLKIQIIQTD